MELVAARCAILAETRLTCRYSPHCLATAVSASNSIRLYVPAAIIATGIDGERFVYFLPSSSFADGTNATSYDGHNTLQEY